MPDLDIPSTAYHRVKYENFCHRSALTCGSRCQDLANCKKKTCCYFSLIYRNFRLLYHKQRSFTKRVSNKIKVTDRTTCFAEHCDVIWQSFDLLFTFLLFFRWRFFVLGSSSSSSTSLILENLRIFYFLQFWT